MMDVITAGTGATSAPSVMVCGHNSTAHLHLTYAMKKLRKFKVICFSRKS